MSTCSNHIPIPKRQPVLVIQAPETGYRSLFLAFCTLQMDSGGKRKGRFAQTQRSCGTFFQSRNLSGLNMGSSQHKEPKKGGTLMKRTPKRDPSKENYQCNSAHATALGLEAPRLAYWLSVPVSSLPA